MDIVEYEEFPELREESDEDEEDLHHRNDFNIEQAPAEFIDEPPIRHNVYPDSDSDDEEDVQQNAQRREREHNQTNRGPGNLWRGQVFFNGIAFKEAVVDYVLKTGRNLKQSRYDKTKLSYDCVGSNCEWRIYCSCSVKTNRWEVKVFNDVHSCVPNGECEMMKVPVIARLFHHKIQDEPKYFMPMKMEEMLREMWKITVSRPQCQAARNKALRWIEKEYDQQFSRLRDYVEEILEWNPGSTVELDTVTNEEGLDVFDKFYVCFESLRRSWKASCRPLIGVDGCFLKSKTKGQLLVALGRDADNSIYPIAWGVVQVENTVNWLWFVEKIKADLGLEDGEGYILISDRQKGLVKAVEKELPKIEHRMCVRHIYGNLKAKHGKKSQMKPFIWNLAWSYNEAEYMENLDRLFNYDTGVYDDVIKSKPRTWCRAFYKIGSHCEDVENNSTESWNNTVVKAIELPLVPMLETIARLTMVRIAKRDVKSCVHKGMCTPFVTDFLLAEHKLASDCKVFRSTNNMFQVNLHGCSYSVSLDRRTCSCRKWEITRIPCEHAYGVMIDRKLEAEEYVSH